MKKTKNRCACARMLVQTVAAAILCVCAAGAAALGICPLFGYSARIVMSSSMEGDPNIGGDVGRIREIRMGSLIVIELLPTDESAREVFYSEIREGDILTFDYKVAGGIVEITHRVKEIRRSKSGYQFVLRGDSADFSGTQRIDTADAEEESRIVGKVVFCSYSLGALVRILRNPLFLVCVGAIFLCVLPLGAHRNRHASRKRKSPSAMEGK